MRRTPVHRATWNDAVVVDLLAFKAARSQAKDGGACRPAWPAVERNLSMGAVAHRRTMLAHLSRVRLKREPS